MATPIIIIVIIITTNDKVLAKTKVVNKKGLKTTNDQWNQATDIDGFKMQLHHPEREYIDQKWDSNNTIDVNPGVEEKHKNSIFIKKQNSEGRKMQKSKFLFQII